MSNYLKFWGTRGSCSVSGKEMLLHGGNTCTLEVVYDSTHILIDAGTGIRSAGVEMTNLPANEFNSKIYLFIGHTHWDHLIGFPFFEPIFEPGKQIHIWIPEGSQRYGHDVFKQLLSPEFFPVTLEEIKADLHFHTCHVKTPITIGKIQLDFHQTNHPGATHCFKITTPEQKIGYVTDNEMLQGYHGPFNEAPEIFYEPHLDLIHFLSDCDLIIHEAQYTAEEYRKKVGWGHSSIPNAASFIAKTGCKEWIVTHHDPLHSDETLSSMEQQATNLLNENKIFCKVRWASDGDTLKLK